MKSVLKKLYVSIGLGASVFLGFSVYLDAGLLVEAFKRFDWFAGLLALVLAAGNYLGRFWRWHFYLAKLDIQISELDSFRIFLSGLALSVTPGKAGELVKAYLVRQSAGAPVGLGVSAVFAERLTDVMALLILSLAGIYSLQEGAWTLGIAAAGIGGLLLVIFIPGAIPFLLGILERFPGAKRLVGPARDAYTNARTLLAPGMLVKGLSMGVLAWMAECVGFYYVLEGFGAGVDLWSATFVYAFATIFGALTLLPGGIGTTEGSMTGLLTLRGVPIVDAAAATFIIRACTLWFAVGIGAVVLMLSAVEREVGDLVEGEAPSD